MAGSYSCGVLFVKCKCSVFSLRFIWMDWVLHFRTGFKRLFNIKLIIYVIVVVKNIKYVNTLKNKRTNKIGNFFETDSPIFVYYFQSLLEVLSISTDTWFRIITLIFYCRRMLVFCYFKLKCRFLNRAIYLFPPLFVCYAPNGNI